MVGKRTFLQHGQHVTNQETPTSNPTLQPLYHLHPSLPTLPRVSSNRAILKHVSLCKTKSNLRATIGRLSEKHFPMRRVFSTHIHLSSSAESRRPSNLLASRTSLWSSMIILMNLCTVQASEGILPLQTHS